MKKQLQINSTSEGAITMAHYECKYCDRPEGLYGIPITVGDEEICACGAEWADAKILVKDEDEEERWDG
ncbi:hypothetical protein NYE70_11305 [Paenibacillus sp. FSL R5-0407]|uniref:hypothetical protein n=1 Tax=Paenibacillus sp. FSL R5-0407 TaxID=2975320 RepID=UPI0030F6B3F0